MTARSTTPRTRWRWRARPASRSCRAISSQPLSVILGFGSSGRNVTRRATARVRHHLNAIRHSQDGACTKLVGAPSPHRHHTAPVPIQILGALALMLHATLGVPAGDVARPRVLVVMRAEGRAAADAQLLAEA